MTLGRAAGLKEVVAETLQPALTADLRSLLDRAIDERRALLLLDGLDEWSDEQAARTTLGVCSNPQPSDHRDRPAVRAGQDRHDSTGLADRGAGAAVA